MTHGDDAGWTEHPIQTFQFDHRERWPSEIEDLTPWVIEQLPELSHLVGFDIRFEGTEVRVGQFRADIYGLDDRGKPLVIEVQHGPSDHKHLGQLVTYACGLDAGTVVWVVAGAKSIGTQYIRNEHRKVLRELNRRFLGDVRFYGVEVHRASEQRPISTPGDFPLIDSLKLVVAP